MYWTATIEGLAPFLFNPVTEEQQKKIDSGTAVGGKPLDPVAEAKARLYRDDHGLYLPGWNVKKMLLDGSQAMGLKVGKQRLRAVVYAGLFPEHRLRFNKTEPDFIHEYGGRIPPKKGPWVLIRRAALDTGWQLEIRAHVVLPIQDKTLEALIGYCGLQVGLGAWRPEYGRFRVLACELRKDAPPQDQLRKRPGRKG